MDRCVSWCSVVLLVGGFSSDANCQEPVRAFPVAIVVAATPQVWGLDGKNIDKPRVEAKSRLDDVKAANSDWEFLEFELEGKRRLIRRSDVVFEVQFKNPKGRPPMEMALWDVQHRKYVMFNVDGRDVFRMSMAPEAVRDIRIKNLGRYQAVYRTDTKDGIWTYGKEFAIPAPVPPAREEVPPAPKA